MDIQDSFDLTIQKSTLSDASVDLAEASIDSLLDNETLKLIPIVKTFVGLAQFGINIHDRLFLKKILAFLQGINKVSVEKRKKMIAEINESKKYRLKVGEKLLYIIDSCDDHTYTENIARLFLAVLQEKITYDQYIEVAPILAGLPESDLQLFIKSYNVWSMSDAAKELTHTGLVYFETEEVSVELRKISQEDWDDPEEHYEADVTGGETAIIPTSVGDTIFEVFGMDKEARRKQIEDESMQRKAKHKNFIAKELGS